MANYLFLFTVGPVQSFIAQARKTQDLYAGSRILSDLVQFAIQELPQGSHLIFPHEDVTSKPNRFLAVVETDDMQAWGDKLKTKVEDHFIDSMVDKVVSLLPEKKGQPNKAESQLRDFLKMYWAAIPLEEGWEANYPAKVKEVETLLGAVKNVRYFNQFAEKGRKCSVNGEYNVLFYRRTDKDKDKIPNPKKTWQERKFLFDNDIQYFEPKYSHKGITLKHIQEGEGLCAVTMAKRLYKDSGSFPSVAYIALMDTLQKAYCLEDIDDSTFKKCVEFVSLITSNGETEYQLFYEENQTEKKLEEAKFDDKGKFDAAFKALDVKLKEKGLRRSKYYAILVFDADSMGKKLAKCKTQKEHQDFSQLLGEFANKAKKLIEDKRYGKSVYAGGDDFLGFLNLNHLFNAIQELRDLFDKMVNEEKDAKDLSHLGNFTFSAGISIAHYKIPLGEVLNWARKMEKEAKAIDGIKENAVPKNALAIAAIKRSGEVHKTLWKWSYDDLTTTEVAKELTYAILTNKVSRKFINTLSWTFENLMDQSGDLGIGTDELIRMELLRLIKRQAKTAKEGELEKLGMNLFKLYKASKDGHQATAQNFFNLLHICEFVNRSLNTTSSTENTISELETAAS